MNLELMQDLHLVKRLVHVSAEVRKCVWDYWVFTCPKCQRAVRLEHQAFNGAQPVRCDCGESFHYNFNALVSRWPGPAPRVTDEIL